MFRRKLGWLSPFVVVFLTLTTMAWAECSQATVKGKYTTLEQGTIVAANPAGIPIGSPAVLTASASFDGAGNVSGTYAENAGGFLAGGTFSGTYAVTSECAYSATFDVFVGEVKLATLNQTGQISGEGMLQEIRYIYTDNFLVVSGTLKKQK